MVSRADEHISTVTVRCEDRKRGLTVDELTDFIAKAHAVGIPSDEPVKADLGWSQQVRSLAVTHAREVESP